MLRNVKFIGHKRDTKKTFEFLQWHLLTQYYGLVTLLLEIGSLIGYIMHLLNEWVGQHGRYLARDHDVHYVVKLFNFLIWSVDSVDE